MTLAFADMTSATCLSCSVLLMLCVPVRTVAAAVVASEDSIVVMPSTPLPEEAGFGAIGAEPKPTYFPPWLGGRWSGREAFSCMQRERRKVTGGTTAPWATMTSAGDTQQV